MPPGKKLQHISLLSGGEKTLTAISLLFAILETRPVPFCILDEVEAALDEVNVDNFGRFLNEFKGKTQFIVITHKKKTMEYAKEKGMTNILLSLGGNVVGIDGRADGTDFKIGIQNPDLDSLDTYIKVVKIADGQCVVSSGDYQRYYQVDGKVYCHIINPDTLYPADTFAQVSILTDDSGKADAYSTAVYNMTLEEGLDFVNSRDDIEAMWVDHAGNITYSDQFSDSIVE